MRNRIVLAAALIAAAAGAAAQTPPGPPQTLTAQQIEVNQVTARIDTEIRNLTNLEAAMEATRKMLEIDRATLATLPKPAAKK